MFDRVEKFESLIAEFFGSPFAVATDSCTHGIELCLRYEGFRHVKIPHHTYLSIPMTAMKLGIDWDWIDNKWEDYYFLEGTNIVDAAVLWKRNSYIPGTHMSVSFQFKKHLPLGRGGMILTDDKNAYERLKMMSYDGRDLSKSWMDQDISTIGYHYYMTPETAQLGIERFTFASESEPKKWTYQDYPDLRKMSVFQ